MYFKYKLSKEIVVPSELEGYFQSYNWEVYPAAGKYQTKMILAMCWKSKEDSENPLLKPRFARRSTYFMKAEHIERLITESVWANLKFRELLYKPELPLPEARLMWLNKLLYDVKEEVIKRWQNGG